MTPNQRCVLAIDPGTRASGYCLFGLDDRLPEPGMFGKMDNQELLLSIRGDSEMVVEADKLAIEMIGHYGLGMPAGKDVFHTCVWIGRFMEAWEATGRYAPALVKRPTVKAWLCGSVRAKDPHVRQALIDRYGGQLQAVGAVKCPGCKGKGWAGRGRPTCPVCEGKKWETPPGPLHGFAADAWSALAVACWYAEHATVIAGSSTDPLAAATTVW